MVHTPMSEIMKNTTAQQFDLIGGAAIQTFALGGKHPRAATYSIPLKSKKKLQNKPRCYALKYFKALRLPPLSLRAPCIAGAGAV